MSLLKSQCCKRNVVIKTSVTDDDTIWFECKKCGKSCNLVSGDTYQRLKGAEEAIRRRKVASNICGND